MKYKKASDGSLLVKKDYSKKIIFSQTDFNEPGHQLQTIIIPPHTKQRMHSHAMQTEVYYILEGECYITIGSQEYVASTGDAFMTHPGDIHNLWNKTDREFKLIVFKINYPLNDEDTTWIE